MKVKDVTTVGTKWNQRASAAAGAYTDGVKSPKQDWAQATGAAKDNWAQGVQQAASDDRFSKGVAKAGTAGWQQGAINKGSGRYGPGVSASVAKYQNGVQPYLQVLQGITLPPRGPKGDPRNFARSQTVGQALRTAKLGK